MSDYDNNLRKFRESCQNNDSKIDTKQISVPKTGFFSSGVNKDVSYVSTDNNFILGIVGALLGSLAGIILWILIGLLGFIAGIAGFIIFRGTLIGFKKLGGTIDLKASIACILITCIAIIVAEIACCTFSIYYELNKEYQATLIEAYRYIPLFFQYSNEFKSSFIIDLLFGYILTFASSYKYFLNRAK